MHVFSRLGLLLLFLQRTTKTKKKLSDTLLVISTHSILSMTTNYYHILYMHECALARSLCNISLTTLSIQRKNVFFAFKNRREKIEIIERPASGVCVQNLSWHVIDIFCSATVIVLFYCFVSLQFILYERWDKKYMYI